AQGELRMVVDFLAVAYQAEKQGSMNVQSMTNWNNCLAVSWEFCKRNVEKSEDNADNALFGDFVSLTKIRVPVRGNRCAHFQCFDLLQWQRGLVRELLEAEKAGKKIMEPPRCRVCQEAIDYVVIDGLFCLLVIAYGG